MTPSSATSTASSRQLVVRNTEEQRLPEQSAPSSWSSAIKETNTFRAVSFFRRSYEPAGMLADVFSVCRRPGFSPSAQDYSHCLVRDKDESREAFVNLLRNSISCYRMYEFLDLLLTQTTDNPVANHMARQLLEAAIGPHENAEEARRNIRRRMLYVHPDKVKHLVGWIKPGGIYSRYRLAQGPFYHGLAGAEFYLAILQRAKAFYEHPDYAKTLTSPSATRGGELTLSDFGQDIASLCRFAQKSALEQLMRLKLVGVKGSFSYAGVLVGLILLHSWYHAARVKDHSRL